ncbi:hypothetical protein Ancab_021285 [Ancistrocladus abbreviatus]
MISASDTVTLQESPSTSMESNTASVLPVTNHVDVVSVTSASVPPSPRLSRKLSDLHGDQAATDYTVDRQTDNAQAYLPGLAASDDGNRVAQSNVADVLSPPVMFKHPTHLITPSEIMAMSSSESTRISEDRSEGVTKIQDLVVNSEMGNVELEVKVVGEAGFSHDSGSVPQVEPQMSVEKKEKTFCSQASDLGVQLSRECCALPAETSVIEEAQSTVVEALAQPSSASDDVFIS